ncbi:MAG: hypothetical protein K0R27_4157 [Xanthobacteraceae bacterium]|jgi:hypothetical protein|nr:hypothetical protein [Xanthobacteraceae bacterium]
MTNKTASYWQKELTAPIALPDGTTVLTLREGAALLKSRFKQKRNRVDLDATILTIHDAAQTGDPDEIHDATLMLNLLLSREGLR